MRNFYFTFIAIFALGFLQAQIIDIPDADFKSRLLNTNCVDTNGDGNFDSDADINNDGEIGQSEAEAILFLDISNDFTTGSITSLSGIEFFTNLELLNCSNHSLSNLDTSTLINLKNLDCYFNQITSLDLTNNLNIERLICSSNQLTSLNIAQNLSLIELDCSSNSISNLDVTALINLSILKCNLFNLENIDVTQNVNLTELWCSNTQLASIDVTQNSDLIKLVLAINSLSTLNVSQNTSLELLAINNNNLSNLDVSQNLSLTNLIAGFNQLENIEVIQNIDLEEFNISNNQITNIDLGQNADLISLIVANNNLSSLDVSSANNLEILFCGGNQISTLDVSQNPNLIRIRCENNQLESLNIKNSSSTTFSSSGFFNFSENPNLTYVCVDDFELNTVQNVANSYSNMNPVINSYCSFGPGGDTFYLIQGESRIDLGLDGCNSDDLLYPNMDINISNENVSFNIISNSLGTYSIPISEGNHVLTPQLENLDYYSVSPTSQTIDFPSNTSPFVQDFCITPNGDFNDLEVVIIPLDQARPGFDTDYKLIYKNKGTTTLSGSVDLVFTDDVMIFVSSSPVVDNQMLNQLSWSYNDLQPFETREINFTMNLNTPTDANFPLNGDDVLEFVATITPNDSDETPNDNVFTLNQTVVNSFDPNDKRCLEGDFIREASVGEYIHYMIRFENTGTANAINVVVKDEIDTSKYDVNTIIPLNASHDFVTRIQNTNEVEFIFENIDLPFDDANNDGYVTFKIKTLETLTVGDSFSNDAEIYFDFNFPIITNDYATTVEDNLSLEDQELRAKVKIFPNPVGDKLFITSEVNIKKVSIYDINGRLLQTIMFYGNETQRTIDLQKLALGVYVVKLSSEYGELTQKIIKE
jgi:Leucine-rich repeat (LRR) protein